jgi:hypothetical protein
MQLALQNSLKDEVVKSPGVQREYEPAGVVDHVPPRTTQQLVLLQDEVGVLLFWVVEQIRHSVSRTLPEESRNVVGNLTAGSVEGVAYTLFRLASIYPGLVPGAEYVFSKDDFPCDAKVELVSEHVCRPAVLVGGDFYVDT